MKREKWNGSEKLTYRVLDQSSIQLCDNLMRNKDRRPAKFIVRLFWRAETRLVERLDTKQIDICLASVHREFKDVEEFKEELGKLFGKEAKKGQ